MKKLIFITLLSLLAVSGWGQCYINKASFSGIENLYSEELEIAACSLNTEINSLKQSKINDSRNATFIVFSYDLYHLAEYKKDANSVENQVNQITEQLTEEYDYYLGVIKHINNENLEYSVTLDVSGYAIFTDYTQEDFSKLENEIAQIMNTTYKKENSNISAEIAGFNFFKNTITQLVSGNYYLDNGTDEDILNLTLINKNWVTKEHA